MSLSLSLYLLFFRQKGKLPATHAVWVPSLLEKLVTQHALMIQLTAKHP
jgi:hypothetical protein